jgi:hypothetical protein
MPDTSSIRLDEHIKESERRLSENCEDIKNLYSLMETKLSKGNFAWIIGVMMTILMAVLGFLTTMVVDIQKTTSVTEKSVSLIQGKLEPYDIEFTK